MSVGKMKQDKYLQETVKLWRGFYQREDPKEGDDIIVHANTGARWIRDGYATPYDSEEYNDLDKELRSQIAELFRVSRLNDASVYYDTLSWIANKAKDALRCVRITDKGVELIAATPLDKTTQQYRDACRR